MSEIDVKNTLEQMFREGFSQGFQAAGGDPRNAPEIRFEWRGRQPVITFNRPKINVASSNLLLPKRINGHG